MMILLLNDSSKIIAETQNHSETLLPTARVLEIIEEDYGTEVFKGVQLQHQTAKLKIIDGKYSGHVLIVVSEDYFPVSEESEFWIKENDKVVVQIGLFDGEIVKTEILSHTRDLPIIHLAVILMMLLLVFGGKKGVKSIITLGFTLFIIFKFTEFLRKR